MKKDKHRQMFFAFRNKELIGESHLSYVMRVKSALDGLLNMIEGPGLWLEERDTLDCSKHRGKDRHNCKQYFCKFGFVFSLWNTFNFSAVVIDCDSHKSEDIPSA